MPIEYKQFEDRVLKDLLKAFSNISTDVGGDVFGQIYEYPQIPLASPGIGTAGGQLRHFLPAQSVAELGFVIVAIDGRGTAWRSRTFHDFSQGRLWQGRLKDHVVALRQLGERYPFLDLTGSASTGTPAAGRPPFA